MLTLSHNGKNYQTHQTIEQLVQLGYLIEEKECDHDFDSFEGGWKCLKCGEKMENKKEKEWTPTPLKEEEKQEEELPDFDVSEDNYDYLKRQVYAITKYLKKK